MTGLTDQGRRKLEQGDEVIVDSAGSGTWDCRWSRSTLRKAFSSGGIFEAAGRRSPENPLGKNAGSGGQRGPLCAILIACVESSPTGTVAARIKHNSLTIIIFTRDLPQLYITRLPAAGVFSQVVIGVSATISTLVILLAMYTTVTERTRQSASLNRSACQKGRRLGHRTGSDFWSACTASGGRTADALSRFVIMRSLP